MASLELGHRLISSGVLIRHIPKLLPEGFIPIKPEITFADEVRFVASRYGSFWVKWALMRASLSKKITFGSIKKHLKNNVLKPLKKVEPYHSQVTNKHADVAAPGVTVLIPTLDRYEYLRKLLAQLRNQSIKPLEILVIDQTKKEFRDTAVSADFADLPLQVIYRDQAGQCSSRNAGLQIAKGDYILFLDDDSEIPDDLIEKHLISLHNFQADASSGVAEEVGAGPIPENFKLIRASDVFPTNNTLIHKSVLDRSGLFDLAYERGQRADGDLGMRVYLSGGFMVLNPEIRILHHHAPSGGLRAHKARVITYASSRSTLLHRHLPSITEIYLAQRYFSPEILREMLWLRVAGTFSMRGSIFKKAAKGLVSGLFLPHTLLEIKRRMKAADEMAQHYPQIPFPSGGTPKAKHESACVAPN
jgi:glycosyltransferase involved in cell wall biosynthesis